MVTEILTARAIYRLSRPDPNLLRAHHAGYLRERSRVLGVAVVPHDDATPQPARVNANRWIVMCPCGCACATGPDCGVACCYECGAVYTEIVFPEHVDAITSALVARPNPANRNWSPGTSVEQIVATNRARGIGV